MARSIVLVSLDSVVVCNVLCGKEPHRQVVVGNMVISEHLCGVMVRTLAWNARDSDSSHNVYHFITHMTQIVVARIR